MEQKQPDTVHLAAPQAEAANGGEAVAGAHLTGVMRAAIDHARKHGGALVRYPGGFWRGEGADMYGKSFGTPTVEALVSRAVAEYTHWQDGRNGRFPIRAALASAREVSKL